MQTERGVETEGNGINKEELKHKGEWKRDRSSREGVRTEKRAKTEVEGNS